MADGVFDCKAGGILDGGRIAAVAQLELYRSGGLEEPSLVRKFVYHQIARARSLGKSGEFRIQRSG